MNIQQSERQNSVCSFQQEKFIRSTMKQEIAHNEKINQSTEILKEQTQMLELADEDINADIILLCK